MNEEKIKEAKDKLAAMCSGAEQAAALADELLRLQRQECEMNKLVDIPLGDIRETLDLGPCAVHRARGGYVFEAKGGLVTYASWRMKAVCAMLQTLFDLRGREGEDDGGNALRDAYSDAAMCVFQAPIFSSLSEQALFANAAALLRSFREYCEQGYEGAEAVPETEEDLKENAQAEIEAMGLEALANAPLPPEDLE